MAYPRTRQDTSFTELLLAIIAFVDLCLGVITLFATLPPIIVILLAGDSGPFAFKAGTIDYVRIIGTFSIAFFAVVEVLSGATYLYCSDCCRSKSCCFGFKSIVFLVLELCEYAIPLCVVKNYSEIVDFLITAPGFYCYVLYLLKFNPLTIGLFVYQAIACLIVICFKNKKSADRKQLQIPQRRRQEKSIPLLPISVYSQPPIITQVQNDANSLAPILFPTLRVSDLDSVAIAGSSRTCSWNYSANKVGTYANSISLYQRLRSNCIKSRVLYEDPDFSKTFDSLKKTKHGRRITWKRPHDIHNSPKFFSGSGVNGVSRFDVKQGELGDCYLLAAIANLTLHSALFHRVVPEDNAEDLKDAKEYAGICHFNFCDMSGNWTEVIIDDRLPTTVDGRLIFMTSADTDEFWSCLLEKAFAKFLGGYEKLDQGGNPGVAMQHFTGGSTENINLKMDISALFQAMDSALKAGNMVSAATPRDRGQDGLVGGHAYSITGVKRLILRSRGTVMLVRIRNPWGNGTEWKGEWRDRHPLWNQVDKRTRKDLELIFEEDGEFWFPLKEFKKYFDLLQICYINSTV